jgi:hypothetical protein
MREITYKVYYFIRLCYYTAATLHTTALEQNTCTSFSAASQSLEVRQTAVVYADVRWWEEGAVSEISVVRSNSSRALWFFGKLKTTVCFFSVLMYRRINFIMTVYWFNMKYMIASNIETVWSCSKWPIFLVNGFSSIQLIVNNFIQCALICSWEEAIYFKWSVLRIYYNHYVIFGINMR